MKNIVITGAEGFIGAHARYFFHELERQGVARAIPLDHAAFNDDAILAAALANADAVFHLAGVNRGSDEDVEQENVKIMRRLLAAAERAGVAPRIVFASSVHETRDTPYGRGKRKAGGLLDVFAAKHASRATTFVFPHVFGEFARPNYNSAVATFCADLASDKTSEVHAEGNVELLYVRDAIARMWEAVEQGTTGSVRVAGTPFAVPDLYALLTTYRDSYKEGTHPSIASRLELHLFNTLHSVMFDAVFPLTLAPKADERGTLYELVRSGHADQVFFSTTKPGKSRGNHYHTRKMERFCVIEGEGEIVIRRLLDGAVKTYAVSGASPVAIDMPTYHTHALKNVGDKDLRAIFWISEQYDPNDPDTYSEAV